MLTVVKAIKQGRYKFRYFVKNGIKKAHKKTKRTSTLGAATLVLSVTAKNRTIKYKKTSLFI